MSIRPTVATAAFRMESRSLLCILAAVLFLTSLFRGQSQARIETPTNGATVEGHVRDASGYPVASATVYLRNQVGTIILENQTVVDGSYKLSGIGDGTYSLEAGMGNGRAIIFGPFALGAGEVRKVDLTLKTLPDDHSGAKAEVGAPEFDDEPTFTVSGVTDAANPGGHGSNIVLQTAEGLTKQMSSLGGAAGADRAPSSATAENALREAVNRSPGDSSANHRLGRFLDETGRSVEALPYLERASKTNPDDFENVFELAKAEANAGHDNLALTNAKGLLNRQNTPASDEAALHHLLGDVEERLGRSLEAVEDYRQAAGLNPSEANLFDWGSELLLHRALEPAAEVFAKGNRLFPRSARMLIGLGVAEYARGFNDEAAQRLCEASDLNPEDQNPYLFLGRMESVENRHSGCLVEKLQRFARLQPANALANYYYALTFDRFEGGPDNARKLAQVRLLLEKAVALDPNLSSGYFRLGVFYSDQRNFAQAIPAYQKALQSNPDLADAHFRLAHAYASVGERSKAQAETEAFRQTSKKAAEQADRERKEIQQFVFTLRDPPPGLPRLAQ